MKNVPGFQRRLQKRDDYDTDVAWSLEIEAAARIGEVEYPTITIANQITHELDRLDVLMMGGLEFGPYLKNPVVGYNHGFGNGDQISIPIGRTVQLALVNDTKLRASWEWIPEKIDERVDRVRRLWDARFIHAASIWYKPDWKSAEVVPGHEEDFWPPLIFHRSLMKEWALVYVPADSLSVRNSARNNSVRNRERRLRQRQRHRLEKRESGNRPDVLQTLVPIADLSSRLAALQQETDKLLTQLRGTK